MFGSGCKGRHNSPNHQTFVYIFVYAYIFYIFAPEKVGNKCIDNIRPPIETFMKKCLVVSKVLNGYYENRLKHKGRKFFVKLEKMDFGKEYRQRSASAYSFQHPFPAWYRLNSSVFVGQRIFLVVCDDDAPTARMHIWKLFKSTLLAL